MRLLFVLTTLLVMCLKTPVQAQSGCLLSFQVKDKPVTIDGIPGAVPQVMKCAAAEKIRTEVYVRNRALIEGALANNAVYLSVSGARVAELENRINDLEAKINRNEPLSALKIAADVVLYELAKVVAILSCVAPEPIFTKVLCISSIYSVAEDSYLIISGTFPNNVFTEIVRKARVELATAKAELEKLRRNIDQARLDIARSNAPQIFQAFCTAIRRDCL